MTNEEKQEIISAVLAALATNSKTIAQLSPKQSLEDSDQFEVAGGSRVTYLVLKNGIREGLALASQLSDYVTDEQATMYLAKLDTETGTIDFKESPCVMLDGFKDVNGYSPATGDLFYENRSGYQIWTKTQGGATGEHANTHVAYINRNENAIYRWTGTTMERIGGGGSSVDIVNSTISTAGDMALAAAQGYVLRREMTKLLNSLSNSAFSTARPTFEWGAPVTYSITQTLTHCTSSHSGNTIDGSSAATITLTPESAYILKTSNVSVTMSGGGSATVSRNDSTGVVTVYIATITGSISITATATVPVSYTVTKTLTHCSSSNSAASVNEGGSFTTVLSADTGYTLNGVTPTITMGGNAVTGAWNASTKTITIAEVTGNIAITATAVVTTTPSVTYNLTSVTKSSGPTEVEEGDSLTAVLSASNDFSGLHPNNTKIAAFAANDVLVMMGGRYVQGATSQSALNADVSVSVANVTADVAVTNVIWVVGTIDARNGNMSTSLRSVCNSTPIPIPDGCEELVIRHNYADGGNYGIAFYNSGGTYVSGVKVDAPLSKTVTIPENAVTFKCSMYDYGWSGNEPEDMYIKDSTHNEYIWKGDNVQ